MDGIRIKVPKKEDRTDTNNVYEWCANLDGKGVRIFYRNSGEVAGNEYHTGSDPSKNPERFFIAHGEIEFEVFNGVKEETILVKSPAEVEIDPWIWHKTRPLTDICYLKYVISVKTDKKDIFVVTKEKFKEELKKLKKERNID